MCLVIMSSFFSKSYNIFMQEISELNLVCIIAELKSVRKMIPCVSDYQTVIPEYFEEMLCHSVYFL